MTDLRPLGLLNPGTIHANLSPAELVEHAVHRCEGILAGNGALTAATGVYTGRSPQDRFLVAEAPSKEQINWGPINRPMEPAAFQYLLDRALAYLQGRELFVFDGWACADPAYRLPVRVITEKAWHALFARCLLLRPPLDALAGFAPEFTILHACGMLADPAEELLQLLLGLLVLSSLIVPHRVLIVLDGVIHLVLVYLRLRRRPADLGECRRRREKRRTDGDA